MTHIIVRKPVISIENGLFSSSTTGNEDVYCNDTFFNI